MSRFSDVVIVLPGLIGSRLVKDDKVLWGTSPGALWSVVAGNGLKSLVLPSHDEGQDDLGDGIRAEGLIDNPEIVPGLWKQGGYSRLRASIVNNLELRHGHNYFEFAYDWRRDNRVNGRRLMRKAHKWLEDWKVSSGNKDAKIVLLAHSMGGLIARYFTECLEGWKTVRLIAAIGTPFRGSGNALDFLTNGFQWKVGPFTAFEGTEALRSFPSVNQLLPTYPFVGTNGNPLKRISEVKIPGLEDFRATQAHAFQDEINNAQAENSRIAEYAELGQILYPIVGVEQPTWQCARLSSGILKMLKNYPGQKLTGDGTVSRVAALPLEMGINTGIFVPNTHSALQSCESALSHVQALLTGSTVSEERFRSVEQGVSLSVEIDDAYRADQPVGIRSKAPPDARPLTARIQAYEGAGPVRKLLLQPAGDHCVGITSLDPGLYRVSIEGEGCITVTDICLVLDPTG